MAMFLFVLQKDWVFLDIGAPVDLAQLVADPNDVDDEDHQGCNSYRKKMLAPTIKILKKKKTLLNIMITKDVAKSNARRVFYKKRLCVVLCVQLRHLLVDPDCRLFGVSLQS